MLFGFCGFQQKPFINDQQNRVGVFPLDLFVCAVITGHLQFQEQIRQANILRLVTLFAGFHPECACQIGLSAPSGSGNKEIPVFCDVFTGCKPLNQRAVQLAPGSIVNIANVCVRLVKSGIMDQTFQAVALAVILNLELVV